MPEDNLIVLAEQKTAPIREKMKKSPGGLICALERDYHNYAHDTTPMYSSHEILQVGIMTPETGFPDFSVRDSKTVAGRTILTNVENPHSLRIPDTYNWGFRKNEEEEFTTEDYSALISLALMDQPPEAPKDSFRGGFGGPVSTTISICRPRLEFRVGAEAYELLEQKLEGWQYYKLVYDIMGSGHPLSEEMKKRMQAEQRTLIQQIIDTEKSGSKDKYLSYIREGIKRGYTTTRPGQLISEDRGITTIIQVDEFFRSREGDLKE